MNKLDDADRAQTFGALKRALNNRQGWNQPPELGHVFRADNGRMRCRALPVPRRAWYASGTPANVLAAYRDFLVSPRTAESRALAHGVRMNMPDNLTGMYLVVEGWAPPAHKTRALYEAVARGERPPSFKDMPDRVETRQGTAVDLDSTMYMTYQPRPTMVLDGVVDLVGDARTGVTGRIPELLFSIMMLVAPQNT